jgi:hypothetical protein
MSAPEHSRFIGLILTAILLTACATTAVPAGPPRPGHTKYFPKELTSVYFGMPLATFQQTMDMSNMTTSNSMSFRISVTETRSSGPIETVIYEFDAEGNKPLYEMIIRYRLEYNNREIAKPLLGAPNHGEEWKFITAEGFNIRAWLYENKLILVGTLPGTEFGD